MLNRQTDRQTLAIFILAHKNYEQVERLVRRLTCSGVDIYIHCDARWNEGYEELQRLKCDSVFIVNKRFQTDTDTWRLIEAPMEMYRFASEDVQRQYKYYSLISGQDYPIVSIEEIVEDLNQNYPKPFIDCTPYDRDNWIYKKFDFYQFHKQFFMTRYQQYSRFYRWVNSKTKRGRRQIKKPVHILEDFTHYLEDTYDKVHNPKRKLDQLKVEIYGGSAWWILPDKIMEYIYSEYVKNDKYIRVISKSKTPEETFFQIMTMRSPLADTVEINPKEMVLQNCKTYAYFFDDNKPFKFHPYEFTISDTELLKKKSNTCYFARKFDITVDKDVFDWVDNELISH